MVAVAVRPNAEEDASLEAPSGRWRNVLRGEEHTFSGREPLGLVLGPRGFGVYERL